ncbi:DUF6196 family protein [Leeia sp.]|uniref:DUF6196 family protein n=1 Tax=Leeia sp. TaxID=2884678 RepID=UPI0035AFA374
MYISQETPEATHARLCQVLAQAELVVHEGAYTFMETPVSAFPLHALEHALAFVRDDAVWSALIPCQEGADDPEAFILFSFHFPPGLDNSGFVGWLASHLKARVGTGVMVVCGQNTARGGIFDYWGAPLAVGEAVIQAVHQLRGNAETQR